MSATHADASNLARTMLDGLISAMAGRGNPSPADKAARARDLWAVIASCEPQDAIQTMFIGQALMFNELIADGGRDVLAGMVDTLKLRAQSAVNGMSRALHQHVAMFLRLRDKSDAVAALAACEDIGHGSKITNVPHWRVSGVGFSPVDVSARAGSLVLRPSQVNLSAAWARTDGAAAPPISRGSSTGWRNDRRFISQECQTATPPRHPIRSPAA